MTIKNIILSLGLLGVSATAAADKIGLSDMVGNVTGEFAEVVVLFVQVVQWAGLALFMLALAAMGIAKLQERQQEKWHLPAMIIGALMFLAVAVFEAAAESVTQEDENVRTRLNNPSAVETF